MTARAATGGFPYPGRTVERTGIVRLYFSDDELQEIWGMFERAAKAETAVLRNPDATDANRAAARQAAEDAHARFVHAFDRAQPGKRKASC